MSRFGTDGGAWLWLRERRLILGCGVAASLPIIVSAAHSVAVDWMPLGDRAYTAVRAFDVFSERTPAVGPWSSGATAAVGQVVYSPGPMLFWLLALPARFLDPSALEVTMGAVNVAAVMGVVGLAHRRGGRPLMFATAIAIPLMLASLGIDSYADIWNSSAPLLPFMLLVFLSWSVACGEYRLLPLAVLVGSFVAQCHLTFVVPTLAVAAVALAGLVASRRSWDWGSVRRWVLAAFLVGLVCWSPALIEQAVNRPGNLRLLARAATTSEQTLGFDAGWRALAHTVGISPWWLRDPRDPLERIGDLGLSPGAFRIGSAVLVLASLAAVTLVGWRRRLPDIWAAGALGLVLCAAVPVDTASTPTEAFATVSYTLRWASPAGMCVWLLLGWALAKLLLPAVRPATAPRTAFAAVAGLGVVAAVGGIVAASADPPVRPYREMRAIDDRLNAQTPRDRTTRVDGVSFEALSFKAGVVYGLRREGKEVVATGAASVLGPEYDPARGYDQAVTIDVDKPGATSPAPASARLVARLTFPGPSGVRQVDVTLLPRATAAP